MFWLQHFTISVFLVNTFDERKLKILKTNQKSEEIEHIYLMFCGFEDFNVLWLIGNIHVCLGCTKTPSPEIGTVSH